MVRAEWADEGTRCFPIVPQEGSCDEASSVAATHWVPELAMQEIRLQVA